MQVNRKKYYDAITIAGRCLSLSKRNPDTFFASVLLPALMMGLFVCLFGGLIRIEGISYVNYIVPGILLQCIGQCSSTTAILMNKDMTSKIVQRYATLPIKRKSILTGHVLEAAARNYLTSAIVFVVALLFGFRPLMGLSDWLVVLALLSCSIIALSWLSVVVGIAAASAEGASALSALAIILPYLSSGFVPTETLPKPVELFAKYQPMTPIIDSMRNALLGNPLDISAFLIGVCWCIGITAVCYVLALRLFQKRLEKE